MTRIINELEPGHPEYDTHMRLNSYFAVPGPRAEKDRSVLGTVTKVPREAYEAIGDYMMNRLAEEPTVQTIYLVLEVSGIREPLGYQISEACQGELLTLVEVD